MTKGIQWITVFVLLLLCAAAPAQNPPGQRDVFKGKLFPPNVVLEHQDGLGLTKEQFTAIRAAVVEVQADVAEHEWDLRGAYREILTELDNSPIDSDKVLGLVSEALRAENEVKKLQVGMLIEIRNLLSDEQTAYLREQKGYE